MNYKRLIPCIFISQGKAIKWFDNEEVLSEDVTELAETYGNHGADELLVFDLSNTQEERSQALELMKKINHVIGIPMVAGGNIDCKEDVEKILFAGAKRALLNFSKPQSAELIRESSEQFGREKIAVSLQDFDALFKQQHLVEQCASEILFMHRLDLDSVMNITNIPSVVLTDTLEEEEILKILKSSAIKGVSGRYISQPDLDFDAFKERCVKDNIKMASFESKMDFTEFQLDEEGLIPVIVQHYRTGEVLSLGYMNKEAFDYTIKTGKMTYYSKTRKELWIRGKESGEYQYIKSLKIDCDKDTLLAKVEEETEHLYESSPTSFYQTLVGNDYDGINPQRALMVISKKIMEQKQCPKEGSYTNYLFDKGIDKILKKVGEESAELIIAAKNPNPEEMKHELSDLLYHVMVLMAERGVTWESILQKLAERETSNK